MASVVGGKDFGIRTWQCEVESSNSVAERDRESRLRRGSRPAFFMGGGRNAGTQAEWIMAHATPGRFRLLRSIRIR